jgi:hypothetical protein
MFLRQGESVDNRDGIDLEGLLDRLEKQVPDERMTLGNMVEAVEGRGFGPILLVPALIVVLPTGAIPGVPTICAVLTVLVAAQLAVGKRHPWLPRRLRHAAISRHKFQTARRKAQPVIHYIDRFIYPRLSVLASPPAPRLIALLAILLAVIMPPLELVPFAVFLPGFALLLLALGLSVQDGVLILVGLAFGGGGLIIAARSFLG